MLIFRSFVFNILFYIFVVIYLIIAIPAFFMPSRYMVKVAQAWGRAELRLVRLICGMKVEIRGIEKGKQANGGEHQVECQVPLIGPP